MALAFISFISLLLYKWGYALKLSHVSFNLTAIEGLLVVLPCLEYYYGLFRNPPANNLLNEPYFWVITGILLLFSCLIPLSLIGDFLVRHFPYTFDAIYWLNFFAYIALFSCFTIGARCGVRKGAGSQIVAASAV